MNNSLCNVHSPAWTQRLRLIAVLLLTTFFLHACSAGSIDSAPSAAPPAAGTDTTPPVVTITGPVSSPTYTSNSATLTLAGSATDAVGVTQVSWSNSLGGSGTASLSGSVTSSSWSVGSITLASGTNVITVTARDAANNTSTDTISASYSAGGADTTAPVVTITGPVSSPTYTSSSATLTLAGSATDAVGVTQVSWSNSLGGSGTASLSGSVTSSSWSVGSIALASGTNVITVTARDAANNTSTDTISVSYSAGGGGATEIPTASGASQLFRYPYLQAGLANQMKILWATNASGPCAVEYKLAGDPAWTTQSTCSEQLYSTATTGLASDFYQHEVTLTGLLPGTSYLYNVLHNGAALARNVGFTTLQTDVAATTQFIVIGDSGTQYSTPRDVRNAIASRDGGGNYIYPHDFVVGVGDIAYYNGLYTEFDANFFNQLSGKIIPGNGLQSILATRAFFPVLGNHEYPGQDPTVIPAAYLDSFSLPVPSGVAPVDAERYYSFDSGNAHFVVIDSERFQGSAPTNRLAEMLAWLDADLAATTKTWRIVFLHRTIFASSSHGTWGDTATNNRMRAQLAPILQNRGVQLVMFGHDHAYQRSKRLRVDGVGKIIRDGAFNVVDSSSGIVYVLTGIGGESLRDCYADPNALFGSAKYNNYVAQYGDGYDFVATRNSLPVLFSSGGTECTGLPPVPIDPYGFTQVSITGSTLSSTTYNFNGVVMDQFSIPAN